MRCFRTRWVCDMLSMLIISRYVRVYNVDYKKKKKILIYLNRQLT